MSVCTFFGHRECPETIKDKLFQVLEALIQDGVDTFYVGNHGQFDACVRSALRQLQEDHPHIRYAVVLASLPTKKREHEDYSDTIFPEGLEDGHPKFAIDRRNKWLLEQADYVVCYVQHTWGGAYKFMKLGERRGKKVINLWAETAEIRKEFVSKKRKERALSWVVLH